VSDSKYDELIWSKASFPDKVKDDEDLILIVREDLSILGFRFLSLFLVFFGLLVIRVFLLGFFRETVYISIYDIFLYSINIVLIAIFALIFHNYYLSLQIVSSERIIDIDQKGLFSREVNELTFEKIEDVTYKQTTFLGVVFNFGNVIVQTAGSNSNNTEDQVGGFVFNNVPEPKKISSMIGKLYQDNQQQEKIESAKFNADYLQKALQQNQINRPQGNPENSTSQR